MGNEAAGAFHTRGLPMWTGVHAVAVSYTAYGLLERIPRSAAPPTDLRRRGGGGGGSGDRKRILSSWKRCERERERESSLYISTGMPAETSPYFSIQSSVLFFLSTTPLLRSDARHRLAPSSPSSNPRERSLFPEYGFDSATGNAPCDERVANDSVGYAFFYIDFRSIGGFDWMFFTPSPFIFFCFFFFLLSLSIAV